jgi:hypothetical protein
MTDETTQPNDEIWIIGFEEEDLQKQSADRFLWRREKIARQRVSPDRLKTEFTQFVEKMRGVVAAVPADAGGLRVEEIQLTAEIGAKGSVNLLGTGGEISGSGGITVTFRRISNEPGGTAKN